MFVWTDGQMYRWMNACVDIWKDRKDGCLNICVETVVDV